LAGRISGFRRYAHPEMALQFGQGPIIHIYVNFLALFRSRFEAISVDFDGRSLRLATEGRGSGPASSWSWISGCHSGPITLHRTEPGRRSQCGCGRVDLKKEKSETRRPCDSPPYLTWLLWDFSMFLRFFTDERKNNGGAGGSTVSSGKSLESLS